MGFSFYFFLLFQRLDIFRIPINFVSYSNVSTISGGIMAVIIFCYFFFSFFTSDMFNKLNPNSIIQTIKLNESPTIYYGSNNFSMFLAVTDETYYYNDSSLFNFQILYVNDGYNFTSDLFVLEMCDPNNIPNDLTVVSIANPVFYCLPNRTFMLMDLTANTNTIAIWFNICVNSTSNNYSCKSNEEINQFLSKTTVQISIEDHTFSVEDYSNPIKSSIRNYFYLADQYIGKQVSINIGEVEIQNDDNLLFNNKNILRSHTVNSINLDMITINQSDPDSFNTKVWFLIFASDDKTQIIRTYQKLPGFLASTMTIVHLLMGFGFFIVTYEHRFRVAISLGSQIYS